MKRSSERILTTHTGSLPRPNNVVSAFEGQAQHEVVRGPAMRDAIREAVREIVGKQIEEGVDVINDGEASKVGYSTYITERLTGFDSYARPPFPNVEVSVFPEFYAVAPTIGMAVKRPVCSGPIAWRGSEEVEHDIANLTAAARGARHEELFMTAASPGVVWHFLENDYYPSDEAYMFAIAEAMKPEYRAIVDAGIVLQLDCPDLAMSWNRFSFADKSIEDFLKAAQMHVEALNVALEGIPSNRVRLHLCWGNYEGPHMRDIPLERIWNIALQAHVDAFSFEGANPRHEHEWKMFETARLPDGKIIIPGVLDSTTNYVEHPELVAQRIVRYAKLVGRENVIAGSDCGFSTFARSQPIVHPTVTWAKLAMMAEGARIASKELWG
jgi:5-methyltetrahydropteroyltriglutamate--homocysteine methyltransferase